MAPYRHTHEDNHVDDSRETYGKGGQEQALVWMTENCGEDFGIERVPQASYDAEYDEEANIENEKNDGYDLEPVAIIRELVKQDRQDAGAHRNYKPSVAHIALSRLPILFRFCETRLLTMGRSFL